MKIGIMSDSHGSVSAWETVVNSLFGGCSLIIHAGDILYHGPRNALPAGYNPQELAQMINKSDIPVLFTKGNCDAEIDTVLVNYPVQAPYAVLCIKDKWVLVSHGTDMDAEARLLLARKYKTDIFISGHTHVPVLEQTDGIVFLNPGSCALPKSECGPTAAVWEENRISIYTLSGGKIIREIDI